MLNLSVNIISGIFNETQLSVSSTFLITHNINKVSIRSSLKSWYEGMVKFEFFEEPDIKNEQFQNTAFFAYSMGLWYHNSQHITLYCACYARFFFKLGISGLSSLYCTWNKKKNLLARCYIQYSINLTIFGLSSQLLVHFLEYKKCIITCKMMKLYMQIIVLVQHSYKPINKVTITYSLK